MGKDVDNKVLLLELGADGYVTKPFSRKELLARVRRAMNRTGAKTPVVSHVAAKHANHEVLRNRARIIVHFGCELTHLVVVAEIHPSKRTNQ